MRTRLRAEYGDAVFSAAQRHRGEAPPSSAGAGRPHWAAWWRSRAEYKVREGDLSFTAGFGELFFFRSRGAPGPGPAPVAVERGLRGPGHQAPVAWR
jgi:hypothetical protein